MVWLPFASKDEQTRTDTKLNTTSHQSTTSVMDSFKRTLDCVLTPLTKVHEPLSDSEISQSGPISMGPSGPIVSDWSVPMDVAGKPVFAGELEIHASRYASVKHRKADDKEYNEDVVSSDIIGPMLPMKFHSHIPSIPMEEVFTIRMFRIALNKRKFFLIETKSTLNPGDKPLYHLMDHEFISDMDVPRTYKQRQTRQPELRIHYNHAVFVMRSFRDVEGSPNVSYAKAWMKKYSRLRKISFILKDWTNKETERPSKRLLSELCSTPGDAHLISEPKRTINASMKSAGETQMDVPLNAIVEDEQHETDMNIYSQMNVKNTHIMFKNILFRLESYHAMCHRVISQKTRFAPSLISLTYDFPLTVKTPETKQVLRPIDFVRPPIDANLLQDISLFNHIRGNNSKPMRFDQYCRLFGKQVDFGCMYDGEEESLGYIQEQHLVKEDLSPYLSLITQKRTAEAKEYLDKEARGYASSCSSHDSDAQADDSYEETSNMSYVMKDDSGYCPPQQSSECGNDLHQNVGITSQFITNATAADDFKNNSDGVSLDDDTRVAMSDWGTYSTENCSNYRAPSISKSIVDFKTSWKKAMKSARKLEQVMSDYLFNPRHEITTIQQGINNVVNACGLYDEDSTKYMGFVDGGLGFKQFCGHKKNDDRPKYIDTMLDDLASRTIVYKERALRLKDNKAENIRRYQDIMELKFIYEMNIVN